MTVYLNNAATSWPKPPAVAKAMSDFMTEGGANFSRGSASGRDLRTMNLVMECRESVASFFGAADSSCVTFCSNVTEALNVVIKGFLRPGMKALTTSMEHNSVMRPLRSLESDGVEVDVLSCDGEGYAPLSDLRERLAGVSLCVVSHASNVCGSLQDLGAIAEICADAGVPLVVDAAQTSGLIPIDVRKLKLSALCFTGHKCLLGPQGTGGIVWDKHFAGRCRPLIEGGTGSFSHSEIQPDELPDKFESGTLNLPGLAALLVGVEYIMKKGMAAIFEEGLALDSALWQGLSGTSATLYGDPKRPRVPVVALNLPNVDNASASHILSSEFGIETRPGIHCSPMAHKTLGSFPHGALRLSPGSFNTMDDIALVLAALKDIASR